ncbi:uncharacterized protein LOC100844675 isoform X3 [Brachypodium distachyon]|nr:uncharacterized protein LOC100844675 isoform X3 [Brachypodium distachyon]KQK09233.1 hypothetical protein BRADI_2g46835v3 [Brachypodium distachyon]PNT72594.1 hypothetical protein BRADI_2g46835v3 [Brachypodium distachyon]PNT72597.1 hypothetical protein BRADI_2g46835v3 [Brachypodium distachyon]|eukprot:XP_010232155.1 uncharacterized protein LOC100844675 isoform X3 [Brachypodium distachyon]
MADHFTLITGRMITEATIQSAIRDAFDVPSVKAACDHHDPSAPDDVQDGRTMSGIVVECRICQEEGDEAYMETPCSCKGSLKYAHRICIQRWCNEKGDIICEICLQQFTPNYSAPLKLFRIGRNSIIFSRTAGETSGNLNANHGQENVLHTADHAVGTSSFVSEGSNPKGATYCRVIAIALMVLLVFRDAISLVLGGPEVYSMVLITLLMLRTAGIVIPIYIILISVVTLLHRFNQQQGVHEATPVLVPGGAEGLQSLQPVPPQQHVISIQ